MVRFVSHMAIIDGRTIARNMLADLQDRVPLPHLALTLAAVLIGHDPALKKFVELKRKLAESVGIRFTVHEFPEDIHQEEAERLIAQVSKDQAVQGIFIELPLPNHLNTSKLLDAIDPAKDVDVLTSVQENAFYNNSAKILPPAVSALKTVLTNQGIQVKNKKVAVFGQGRLIGKPISHWLEAQDAQVARIDIETLNPEIYSREVDIVITGVGKPDLITADIVKEGAVVIDFGYGKKDGNMVGDVAFEEVSQKASLITPVPGGMGPILIAAVLENLVLLSLINNSD